MTSVQDNLFRTILYSIGDAVITTDSSGRIRHMNHVAEKLTGWNEPEARGRALSEVFRIINEKTRRTVENPSEKVLQKGVIVGLANHTLLISKDGHELPIADSGAPIKTESGEITGVVLVFRDMTEEIKMQKSVEYSERKYRSIFDQSIDMIYLHDLKGRIIEVNRAAINCLGYSHRELAAMNVFDIHAVVNGRDGIMRQWQTWQAGGESVTLETNHKRKDGSLFPVEVCTGKVAIGENEVILALVRDVTERRKAIREIEQGREWYRSIAEDIPALITRLSPEMKFTYANDLYCRLYNQSRQEIVGRDLFQFVPSENKAMVKEALLSLTPDNSIHVHEHINEACGGEAYWIRWTNRALFDGQNIPGEYICVGIDITEQKKAEKELRESESRSMALVGAVPDMFFRYTGEGAYLDAEIKDIRELTVKGRRLYERGTLIGSMVNEVLEPAVAKPIMNSIKKTLATGKLQVVEYSYMVDKQQHYFEARLVSAGKNEIVSIVRNITNQRRVENNLQYQLQFETMVANISSAFVNLPVEKIDQAINYALELSGEFFNVDRSYICRFSEDSLTMDNTHEWCADGISSMKARNQGFLLANTPWWAENLRNQQLVYVPDVEALPPEADRDKMDFLAEGTKSFLTIPMVNEGKVIGIYGFKEVSSKKSLADHQVAMLKVVAEIISGAIIKHETGEALKESESRFRDILATIEEAYYETDLAGNIIFFNEAGLRLYGYTAEEACGISYRKLYKDPGAAFRTFHRVFTTGSPEKGLVLEMIRKDGSIFFGEISVTIKKDKKGFVTGFKGIGRDVTERIKYEKRLEHLSMRDQLTGIYNRTFFETELSRLSKSREFPITIISADLDGLKLINDTMGHDAGDRMLRGCSSILEKSLRQSDILARVGGDEFSAILLRTDKVTGEAVVRRIRKNVNLYNRSKDEQPLGISIGVATAEHSNFPLNDLFKRADDLMYRDKLYSSISSRSKIVRSLLAALAERDYITEGHVRRLEEMCRAVGEKLELSSHQLADLTLFAQVHDLGKVGIPDQILFKPGPLTGEEWEIMRGHPEKGYRIATSSPDLSSVADLILKHHERWDGGGYPLGLKEEEIPVECRILAIVDAFDAMTNNRPYKATKTATEAVEELKVHAGSQFDPQLVPVFLSVLKEGRVY